MPHPRALTSSFHVKRVDPPSPLSDPRLRTTCRGRATIDATTPHATDVLPPTQPTEPASTPLAFLLVTANHGTGATVARIGGLRTARCPRRAARVGHLNNGKLVDEEQISLCAGRRNRCGGDELTHSAVRDVKDIAAVLALAARLVHEPRLVARPLRLGNHRDSEAPVTMNMHLRH